MESTRFLATKTTTNEEEIEVAAAERERLKNELESKLFRVSILQSDVRNAQEKIKKCAEDKIAMKKIRKRNPKLDQFPIDGMGINELSTVIDRQEDGMGRAQTEFRSVDRRCASEAEKRRLLFLEYDPLPTGNISIRNVEDFEVALKKKYATDGDCGENEDLRTEYQTMKTKTDGCPTTTKDEWTEMFEKRNKCKNVDVPRVTGERDSARSGRDKQKQNVIGLSIGLGVVSIIAFVYMAMTHKKRLKRG
jgi:hypothetical protein